MEFITIAIGAIFVAWWLISACNQIRAGALTLRVRRHIPLGLIPIWTFFAPNPARADARLIWREEQHSQWGEWQELYFGFGSPLTRWLFNPELILNKSVMDLTNALLRRQATLKDRRMLLSPEYLMLLSIVLAQPATEQRTAVQFAIVRSRIALSAQAVSQTDDAGRKIDVVFISEVHNAVTPASHVFLS